MLFINDQSKKDQKYCQENNDIRIYEFVKKYSAFQKRHANVDSSTNLMSDLKLKFNLHLGAMS